MGEDQGSLQSKVPNCESVMSYADYQAMIEEELEKDIAEGKLTDEQIAELESLGLADIIYAKRPRVLTQPQGMQAGSFILNQPTTTGILRWRAKTKN